MPHAPAGRRSTPWTSRLDHVVVGGGVVGAAAARSLAARGEQVLLVEQHDRGHEHGSSHGATRIFRMGYTEPDYVTLTQRAWDAWAALEAASGRTLLDRTGAVDHGRPEVIDAIAHALERAGVPFERLDLDEAAARWPGLAFEGHVLAHGTAGRIRSAETIEALLDLAASDGAALRFGVRVTGLDDHGHTVTVHLDDGTAVMTPSVVAAVGSWAPTLVGELFAGRGASLPAIRVTQEQPAHFPSHLPDDPWPSFVHYPLDGGDVYGLLTPGEGVKVGFHGVGPVVDPDARDRTPVAAEVERLQAYVARFVPGVDATAPALISCLYDNSPSDDFVMDRRGPLTVATGFSGHGFKFAPVLGEMLADLATGGVPHPRFAL
ncbi:FAD-dependent oxidoreductase [Curtobacterium sp. MCJR17_055]|uniref:FAD-dependent oxidoreductase n=1 Tax=unclassified Curtobacterium TaxID=257496 RepID=UPI000D94F935|nr:MULTISPECIES: FAD-dependent oxidoreductase [unclassified Curtobacterium]PYY33754.1 FAD-dependent oxidoreductase [Curtobacterium sp. MCBD17_029]PYY58776.1 FAD-dependent oxidoreductase [Curtobacterium sp. MCJR17_055]PYY59683.1 FAD-dependent oxidoreductase [Curtobacterium sp. MCPF17_015]WIB36344.1 FAD-dependent oxidoreductase [Curtobacterium sp. MCJR17_043]